MLWAIDVPHMPWQRDAKMWVLANPTKKGNKKNGL